MPVSLYSTPLNEITRETIEELIEQKAEEGQLLDFKKTLMAEGQSVDPWEQGQDRIGNYAKVGLARAVCSFANASGGWIILGIDEKRDSDDTAAIAASKYLLPRVAALASRLNQALFDAVDPPPIGLSCRGITFDDEGSGVVVIRQLPSIDGPHRVDIKSQREAYLRVADRNVRMNMRQIRDRVLATSSRLADVENALQGARERFLASCGFDGCRYGYQIAAALTLPPVSSRRVYRQNSLSMQHMGFYLRHPEGAEYRCAAVAAANVEGHRLSPRLRGGVIDIKNNYYNVCLTVLEAGSVDIAFWPKRQELTGISAGWLLADTMAVLDLMSRLREFFDLADSEFAVELSIWSDRKCRLHDISDREYGNSAEFRNIITTPAIRVSEKSDFSDAAIALFNDLRNSVGWPDLPDGFYLHEQLSGPDPKRPHES